MKINKLIRNAAFIWLLSCISASAFDPCDRSTKYVPIAERYTKGLFFTIKKCGVRPSYILGTIHSDNPKVVDMHGDVFAKLAYATSADFEIKMSPEVAKSVLAGMYLEPGSIDTLQSVVGVSAYNKFTQLMARTRPKETEMVYYKMRPWAAAVLLAMPADHYDGVALDIKLEKFAESRGIVTSGLESAESQLAIFNELPLLKQIGIFNDAVDNYAEVEKNLNNAFDAYYAKDLTRLKQLADEGFETYSDKELAAQLKLELVDKRNRKMADKMSLKIDNGNAFIAIGALHLPGKEGVLRLLEDKGYYIEVVPDSATTMAQ